MNYSTGFQSIFGWISRTLVLCFTLGLLAGLSISNAWAAPIPKVTLANVPDEVLVGEDFSFDVTFKNAGNAEGYGPYIELYLPAWGADGNAPAPSTTTPPLKCDGIRYIGAEALFTSPSSLTLTPEPPTPSPLSSNCPPSSFVHPFAGSSATVLPLAGTTTAAGHQLVVIKLPLGSFEPGQPPIRVKVKAHVSNYADTGVPLKIYARGGFQYGASPTGTSVIEMPGSVKASTTPSVFTIKKTYLGPENEIAAGPNFVGGYEIPVDIADGQTIDHLTVSDTLPLAMQYEGGLSVLINGNPAAPGASCGSGVDYTVSPLLPIGGMLSLKFCHSITGTTYSKDVAIYYNFSITQDGLNKNCKPFKNINKVQAYGKWLPLDPRDHPGITVKAKFKANHPPLLSKCMAIQKSVLPLGDPKPGDTLNYTLNFQVSDYKTIGKLIATDLLSDGQTLVPGSATMTLKDRTGGPLSAPVTAADVSITPHAHFKCKTNLGEVINSGRAIQFDISNWMGAQSGASTRQLAGILTGGLAASPASPVPVIGTINFSTKVADSFSYNPPGATTPVVKDDPLCNSVTITGKVYHYKPDINVIPSISNVKAKDDSGTLKRIASDTIRKTVYAVVRSGVEICGPNSMPCVLPPAAPEVRAGDVVTFRIEKAIPSGDADHLVVTDWLPLPVFSVDDPDAIGGSGPAWASSCLLGTLPSPGVYCYGPTNTPVGLTAPAPAFSTNSSVNSLSFNYGSFNNPANTPRKIDLLFSVTVSTAPFADGLYLTNEALETEQNTFGVGFGQVAIAQVNLREPALSITKGVVATDNPNGVFTPAGLPSTPFTAPSAGGCPRFAAPITSGGMINSNLSGVDAGDQVTFAIAVENSGGSPAYDINLNDLYPVGQNEDPTCFKPYFDKHNFCVTDGAGTPLPFSISAPLGSGSASIHLTAPLPAIGTPPPGSNVAVITFNGTLLDKDNFMAGCCDNEAELTHYASIPGGQDFVHAGIGGPFEATAKVCSGPEPHAKCIQSTSEAHTTPPNAAQSGSVDAAIGEIVRYRLITTIPEGTTQDFQIKDLLPAGLTYVGNPSVTFVTDSGSVTSPPYVTPQQGWPTIHGDEKTFGQCPGKTFPQSGIIVGGAPFTSGLGVDPIFFVGNPPSAPWPPVFDIYNPDNDANQELVIIEFNVLVDNMNPPNINAAVLPNKFEVSYKDSHSNPSQTITQTSGPVNVKVVEPALAITKTLQTPTAANMLTFNLHVTNTSGTDAFDVVVSDALPACLTGLSNVNVTPSAGASNVSTPTQLNVTIAKLLAGQSVDVSYQIHQGCAADQCPVVNTATVTWTSLPGPNGTISNPTGSSTPGASGANNGERNGTGANPPSNYHASASLDICGKVCVEKKESGGGLLGGWEVNVGSTPVTPITTSASGPVCINMPAGVYSLSEQLQGGWSPVSPAGGTTTATVLPGSTGNFTFVNKKMPAEHFKCYDVDPDSFKPLQVTLEDQFGVSKPTLLKTKYICTPVNKNNEGIIDPVRHQVCYEMKPTMSPNKLVEINNQFGAQTFTVKDERLLCVPSTKKVLKMGKICGHKFNDLNGNGTWNLPPEPGLQGWTINATNGSAVGSATTDASGKYCIDVPSSATPYAVTEVAQSSWTQTAPTTPHSVTVASGQTVNGINFGNQAQSPPCCLHVNKTALTTPWQAGGQGVFTLEVQNTCSTPISYPANTLHVKDMFNSNFAPVSGTGSGWTCTGSGCVYAPAVTLAPGATLPDLITVNVNVGSNAIGNIKNCANAGIQLAGPPQWCPETCITIPVQQNKPGRICGYKFNDLNGNGTWDQPPEPGLQGWTINATNGSAVGSATTDASGKYCIDVPSSATPYAVTEVAQSSWTQTAPATPHSVTVASGQTVNNINFGNHVTTPPQSCCVKVNKVPLGTPWQAGGQGVFTLEVENSCSTPITVLPNVLQVLDNPLGTNLSFVSVTGSSWSCSSGFAGCMYTNGFTLNPGQALGDKVSVTVDVGAQATGNIVNCAQTGLITGPVAKFCNTECATIPVNNSPSTTIEKTALKAPWQAGSTGTFEITATSPWTITGTPSVPIIIKDIVLNPPFSLSVNQPGNAPWVCNDLNDPFIPQYLPYWPNTVPPIPSGWFVCTLDTNTNPVNIGDPLPPIHLNVDIDPAYKGGVVHNCAEIGRGTAAMPEWYQDQGCVDVPVGAMKNIPAGTTTARPPHVSIVKKHSPSRFSTGSKGMFEIKVTNRGKTLTKGMLKVTDHMPVGLTVKSGKFIADLWSCEGGMVSSRGQNVACVFNKTLRKNRWSAIKLNTFIAPESQFPAAVNVVKNCATVSVRDAAGVVAAGPKVCDKVRIKHVESSGAYSIPIVPSLATPPNVSIEKKHSPSRFSTGSKGTFSIKVKNKGAKLGKGMLRVMDHMPGGLSVKTGTFRVGSWSCKGGMVASSGQDVTCAYNRTLGKHRRATLRLNARVAPKGRFPAGVNEVENCATASVQGAAGVVAAGPKVCDKVRIRHRKSRRLSDLPINIGIGIGSGGGGRGTRAPAGAVGP